jgi:predicted HNH restriction endonuclease
LIAKRKVLDDYMCQACGFQLEINDRYIIDCHHINPIGLLESVTVTHIDHLVCLCPTCHRIAHTQYPYPLSLSEITEAMASRNQD